MEKLLLFDIDGTLVAGANGPVEAFAVAFQEVYDLHASIYAINPHGKTDQEIIQAVLLGRGVPQAVIDKGMEACMEVMCSYFSEILPCVRTELLPGVAATLAMLDTTDNLLGLVTGNLEPIAHGKLGNAGVDKHFKLGGFGSDNAERSQLVEIAKQKAARQFGFVIADNVYLFGDTPQDILAAVAGGAKAIGVTTGTYNNEALYEAGADVVISGLGSQDEVLSALS
jgi:phosphoglycolate phosphatase-like HAD superfamily hydrolase